MNLKVFCITIFGLFLFLICCNTLPLSYDIFARDDLRNLITFLPQDQRAALTVKHAIDSLRYDIGLFGNSRIEMIGQKHIGEQYGHLFNFAIPKSSFRQSIRLIEELFRNNKAPRICIISLDHLGLNSGTQKRGAFPGFPTRIIQKTSEMLAETQQNKLGVIDVCKYAYWIIVNEVRMIYCKININLLIVRLQLYLPAFSIGTFNDAQPYRQDGSFVQLLPPVEGVPPANTYNGTESYPLLKYDFKILGKLVHEGIRVIVYESPLSATVRQAVENGMRQSSRSLRKDIIDASKENGVEFYGSPVFDNDSLTWPDTTHPPAQLLGGWLRSLIDNTDRQFGESPQ